MRPKIGGIGSMAMAKAVRPVPPAMPLVRAVTCSTRLAIGIAPTNKYSRSPVSTALLQQWQIESIQGERAVKRVSMPLGARLLLWAIASLGGLPLPLS